jgi:hypothetical protein
VTDDPKPPKPRRPYIPTMLFEKQVKVTVDLQTEEVDVVEVEDKKRSAAN